MFAAAFQTSRTAMQQRLRALLSVSGAGFVRYAYGAPLALGAVLVAALSGVAFPAVDASFWPLILAAGVAQIVGTIFLISSFDARNYAVGTVLSKTEIIQVAVFSAAFLGESLHPLGWVATGVCMAGIVTLTSTSGRLDRAAWFDRAGRFGLLAGGCFGLASVGIRAATKQLHDSPAVMKAIVALAVMNTAQTIVHGGYLAWRDRVQIGLAMRHWRSSSIVGVLSVAGSACWALAFTLQNVAKVRTLGQVELIFTFVAARWFLRETTTRRELAGGAIVLAGVVGVMTIG
jgi:drug/metabolite transporter (DMT)-like permease